MLTPEQMRNLKKVNVSKDAEKTKERVSADFKSTSNAKKSEIVALSGQTRASIYRVSETGVATPKTVLAMSQILDVSPYYYTGEQDEKGECGDDVLKRFLLEHGYKNIVEGKPGKKRTLKDPAAASDAEGSDGDDGVLMVYVTFDDSPKMKAALAAMDEDSAVVLLHALFKRAQASDDIDALCDLVKRCLLS